MNQKLDRWPYFVLSNEDRQLVDSFAGPQSQRSFLKDVPIGALEQVRPVLRRIRVLTGRKTYIMFRGPKSRYYGQSTTWKQDANRFAVYFR